MNITTSTSSHDPAPASSHKTEDTDPLPSGYPSTDSEPRGIQESTITSEGKNSEKNTEERNESKRNVVIKEEFLHPPPHLLEPQTPTPGNVTTVHARSAQGSRIVARLSLLSPQKKIMITN